MRGSNKPTSYQTVVAKLPSYYQESIVLATDYRCNYLIFSLKGIMEKKKEKQIYNT
jgi:hypothetical protein